MTQDAARCLLKLYSSDSVNPLTALRLRNQKAQWLFLLGQRVYREYNIPVLYAVFVERNAILVFGNESNQLEIFRGFAVVHDKSFQGRSGGLDRSRFRGRADGALSYKLQPGKVFRHNRKFLSGQTAYGNRRIGISGQVNLRAAIRQRQQEDR